MKLVRRFGLVLVTGCAFSAVAVSGASASPLFLSHPAGGLLLASAGGSQIFTTTAGSVSCTKLKLLPPDTTPALQFLSILVALDYEKCTAFGLSARYHPFLYRIDANGLVSLENTVLILSTGCTVTIPAAKNQSLTTVKFENTPANKGVLLLWALTKITSFGIGAACTYAEESNGVFQSTMHFTVEGGTLRWDP
jgi:hypothetical protein